MTILNNFLKTYTDRKYQYTVQVNHKGTVIAFAMDELRRIYYSVLDLENTQIQGKSPLDVNYWLDNPKEISFPNEIAQVGYAILPNVKMGLIKKGTREEAKLGTLRPEEVDPFLSTTARFTAQAPFQVLSDGKFIYVFRQAIGKEHSDMIYKKDSAGNFVLDKAQQKVPLVNETLLVDRYILAGTELKLKMEVRYQRSRHKYNPQTSKDGLGAKDLEKKPFFEPTQELDFVRNLKDGRFSVLLLPTQIADLQRWQLFTHNSKTGLIDCFNVERSSDGLFNTKGTQLYTSPDPEYQNSVLERQPGTDSFTGEPLIPVISQSGYAESALDFDGQDDYVQLPALPENLFQTFTIETWVYYRSFSPYSRIFDFGNGANSDNILLLADASGKTSFGIFIGGSGDYVEVYNILEINKWIHLAVAMDQSGNVTLYKDGVIVAQKKLHLPQNLVRNQNYLGKSNWSGDAFFNGQMDEVRLWNRCRSQSEIKAALNQRLVGDEPGLWAYYRFDEGLGDRLHDQTENAMHATIQGATWVKSDAPIGDHPGLQRTSFSLKSGSDERQIASGLASVLYHQQEKVATGYDQQEKPVKRNARVMLTVGTSNSATPDQNFIAALDFAVSREGKIAQAPDCLTLPILQKGGAENQDLDDVSRLQEEISTLKASINQLETEISGLRASTPRIATLESQKARLESEIESLNNDLNNKKQDIFNYFCRICFGGNSGYLEANDSGNLSYQNASDRPGQYWKVGKGFDSGSKSLSPSNHLATGARHFFGNGVFPRALQYEGSLQLVDSPASMMASWQFSNYRYDGSKTTLIVDTLVQYGSGTVLFRGELTLTQTDRPTSIITDVENPIRNKRSELSNTINELNKLYGDRERLQEKESQLPLQKVQLENKETALELARSGVQGEVALPMSWLHTDPCGLTVAGGLLNFAYTKDTPLLVNGATGNVALYFRGVNDQFFVTYYDTNTTKAQHLLEVETGKLVATARSAEPECDHATFTISDSDTPETCTLTITNSATKLEETWQHLPRDVEQFCNILNGGAREPIFIGKLEQSVSGDAIDSLTLSQRPKQTLAPGSILSVGNRKVVVSGDTQTTDETIAIAPISLGIPADAAVYLIPYDYEAWTSNNRTSNSLDQGSLQFIFQPGSSSGKVQNGTITGDDTTLSCQWVAESPGRALSFDGQNDYVKLADSAKLSKFDAKGDLTLEAWVRSAQLAESARVIHHHSANSQYMLGVQSKESNSLSAIKFDGVDDYIELPAACIPTGNEITMSFWAFGGEKLPSYSVVLQALDANNTVLLDIKVPWVNSYIDFECGSSGGNRDGIYKISQASDFKGVWSHWAFTKNATLGEMKIYLNGRLWHSETGKTTILTQATKVRLGSQASGGNYYNGSLDELQIWNKARSEAEIQSDMNRRLTGNEPGLMGYWQFTGGIAKDYSPNGYHGQIFGQPAIVASAIQDKQIYSFAGVGNLFLKSKESAPLAQWHHLSAVYNQSYALQFKGNGFLECDHNPTLDLDRDLSIEVFLQVGSLNQRQGILTKGKLEDGTTQNVPYSLYLDTDGKIAFAFEDKKGKSYVYKSREALQVGQFYKIAVTRQHQIEVKNQGSAQAPDVIVNQWADIRFYIAQKAAGYDIYKGADLDRNSQKLEIGRTYQGSQPNYFQGFISEVRLWNTVVDLANLGMKINGQEKGLIAWWRLEENEGNIASDSKGESHAVIIAAQWVKNPDPQGSSLTLYQNGLPVPTESFTPQNNWGEKQFSLGGASQNVINPLPTNGLLVYLTGDSYQGGESWNDLSSRGNHAIKSSSFAMPSQYSVNDYNGKSFKVMRFNGNCGMTLPDSLNLQKPFTAIIVDRYYGNTKGRTLTSRDNNWLHGKHSGNNGCFMEGWVGSPYAATPNTFTISTVTLEGTTSNWFVDGVLKGSGGGITAPGKLGLCRGGAYSGEASDADIAAILIWDRVLSESERHKVEKWLGEQYGIPISHPVDLGGVSEPFAGIMEEVRIWKVARTQEQIQDNLFSRIKGEKQDLIANYTFDLESQTELFDQSLMGNHLTLGANESKPTSVLSTAPISQDTAIIRSALAGVKTQFHETIHSSPAVQEYSDLQYDIEGNLIGIQKRCYGYIKNGQWNLLTGYKVGNLITEWIGQVQADPQIIGYIEGAPPVPSENLTGEDPYNETSIQLVEADSVNYIYSSSKESGFDMSMETVARLGLSQRTSGGIGLETQIADVTTFIGGKATFESSQGSVDEASVSYGYNTTKVSRLQTLGTREKIGSELNPYVGRRYVPNNVGLALVQSDTMDVFALRLAHNNALVSYRFLPNPDIPKDWNIITFPINPTYTKQGTLDGKIGLKEDGSVQADPHYPNAATYGQWSYFKPIEAYSLKKRIERQRQELATYYDQYSTFQNVSFQASGTLGELPSQKMATRNLVNTHVWTADGGFFSESTDVMEATSETTTGNYSFQGMAGLSIDLNVKVVTAVSLQLDALFGGHVATTKTKGRETEKSFAVEVEMAVERDIQLRANTETLKTKYHGQFDPEELGVYDAQGNPIKQPGKVDAYRFMTFYFEPTTENFEDFFGKVVDPIWLEQSSEPNAIALRQANQGDKKPSCWRIFHRVTFVSRILPEIAAQNAPPLEKAIRAANIESNWELIKKLEPFVQTKTQDFVTFADAVRTAIATYLPELQGYEQSVIQYMALYYGLPQ
ncbi:MAG: LamG-like jellyroll fold domain-containing protein [Snowella sp.]|nr:LamG-like jellyroll fold domain-containing protein [Snowella sp.]